MGGEFLQRGDREARREMGQGGERAGGREGEGSADQLTLRCSGKVSSIQQ